jgi:DNA-binding MarR family transcriptional regulator
MQHNSPISNLAAHLGYWMRLVSNTVSQSFARKVESEDVIVAEWVMMRRLYEGPGMAPSLLAQQMGMTKGAITKLCDRLLSKGLVRRMANAHDNRAQIIALTDEGRAKVPVLAALADENDQAFFGCLEPEERQELSRLLKKIARRHDMISLPVT